MASASLLASKTVCQSFQKACFYRLRQQYVASLARHVRRKLSLEEQGRPCSFCLTQHQRRRMFHTSAALEKTSTAKKKPLYANIKNRKKKNQFQVILRPHMTTKQLASACRTDIETIYECLKISVGNDSLNSPEIVISNMKLLKDVVKQLELDYTTTADKVRHSDGSKSAKVKDKTPVITDVVRQPPPDPSVLVKRPPVVTIMGHVDHGKTTLLDAFRKSNVIETEFGGITQHIGAFSVKLKSGDLITFLDTPGHAAFTAMRARGASVTDIVILVVAAEDGVMETTVEAIQHTKDAKVPIIVAINKIDKPTADIEGCKRALLGQEIVVEDYGGDVQAIPISALKGTNLDLLQESIILQAEVMELKGDPTGSVEGYVIESKTDPKRGKQATALIQRGTLKKGNILVAGTTWARVKAMFSDIGTAMSQATPSTPVEIMGWKELPTAGDEILQVESEKVAQAVVAWRKSQVLEEKVEEDEKVISQLRDNHQKLYAEQRAEKRSKYSKIKWHRLSDGSEAVDDVPCLSIVLKGDVHGSTEAILDTLSTFESKLCKLNLISHGVGEVTEHDIQMAESFNGVIYAFNVGVNVNAANLPHKVPIKHFNVIYKMFDDLIESLNEILPPLEVEDVVGEADVLQIFPVKENKKRVMVGGCKCTDGKLHRKNLFQVIRKGETVFKGNLKSLKHFKAEVETIGSGQECGVLIDSETNLIPSETNIQLQTGDTIQCIEIREEDQEIDWLPGF